VLNRARSSALRPSGTIRECIRPARASQSNSRYCSQLFIIWTATPDLREQKSLDSHPSAHQVKMKPSSLIVAQHSPFGGSYSVATELRPRAAPVRDAYPVPSATKCASL
jgi:hypothetical protein